MEGAERGEDKWKGLKEVKTMGMSQSSHTTYDIMTDASVRQVFRTVTCGGSKVTVIGGLYCFIHTRSQSVILLAPCDKCMRAIVLPYHYLVDYLFHRGGWHSG